MLIEKTLFGIENKVKISIERIKNFEPKEGYWLGFSGGKDSVVVYDLALKSGVKFEAHFSLTTVDPKEVIQFVKTNYPTVILDKPQINMWNLIIKKGFPPTRIIRYCCDVLKERGGEGRLVMTGIRWEESSKRSHRKMVENCYKHKGKTFLHPIIDWTKKEVWQYIRENNLPYCCLYDKGFTRIGCIGCPNSGSKNMVKEFNRFPQYRNAYIKAFQKMIEARILKGKKTKWKTGEDVMRWWLKDKIKKDDQSIMFDN